MPGRQVKNWKRYHALRRKGMSKSRAARITNGLHRKKRKRRRRKKR
jgi:hypothetical protein